MTEADRQRTVCSALTLAGYRWAHFRPARVACRDCKGAGCRRCAQEGFTWRTPVEGQGEGFPDVYAVHPGRGDDLFIEFKADKGVRSGAQVQWADALLGAGKNYWLCDSDETEIKLIEHITKGKVQ